MALDNAGGNGNHDTEEKNLDQFEKCKVQGGRECRYCDTNGRCIFETCIADNEYPPQTLLWYFECIACKEIDSVKPRNMKIHFCRNCIKQLQTAQVLPFKCIFCGSSQAHRGQGFGNQICDSCVQKLKWFCGEGKCYIHGLDNPRHH
jgi:hypothetical protein